ncbi:MAG: ethylbenzene dehydrogenase-related protein [Pseudomonadota bacterium]
MRVRRVSSVDSYGDPAAPAWQEIPVEAIEMTPAPLGLQPTEYIQVSWDERDYGEIEEVSTRAIHDGTAAAVHLSWASEKPSSGAGESFPDAAAVAFPVRGDPILMQMGSDDAPMQFIQWQASRKEARSVVAKGIGSSLAGEDTGQKAKAAWSAGRWSVVFSRLLGGGDNSAKLVPGEATQIGFAVWNGSNEERAGIKAVSIEWTEFELEG